MVVVVYEGNVKAIPCPPRRPVSHVKRMWQHALGAEPSVAFFSVSGEYVPDYAMVADQLPDRESRSFELRAKLRSPVSVELHGFEGSVSLDLVLGLPLAAVRRDIAYAAGVVMDNFRVTSGPIELQDDAPLSAQGISAGDRLIVDPRLRIVLRSEDGEQRLDSFGSETVGGLRERLGLDADHVLVITEPRRRVLPDPLQLCHVPEEAFLIDLPLVIHVERKLAMAFEPLGLESQRQLISVALSATPQELHEELAERFELKSDFRVISADGPLHTWAPLLDQGVQPDSVLQIDIARPLAISDQWTEQREEVEVREAFAYSSESVMSLFETAAENNLRLSVGGLELDMRGPLCDTVGPLSGRRRSVLLIEKDERRSLPFLTSGGIERRWGFASDLVGDVAVKIGSEPRPILCHERLARQAKTLSAATLGDEALMTVEPLKIVVKSGKRFRVARLPHRSIIGDIGDRGGKVFGRTDLGLSSKLPFMSLQTLTFLQELDLFLLEHDKHFKTRVAVHLKEGFFPVQFVESEVKFTDIMIAVGKAAKKRARLLFSRPLFCCGCGRRVTQSQEKVQSIPSPCCGRRSLELTDRPRRGKAVRGGESSLGKSQSRLPFRHRGADSDAEAQARGDVHAVARGER